MNPYYIIKKFNQINSNGRPVLSFVWFCPLSACFFLNFLSYYIKLKNWDGFSWFQQLMVFFHIFTCLSKSRLALFFRALTWLLCPPDDFCIFLPVPSNFPTFQFFYCISKNCSSSYGAHERAYSKIVQCVSIYTQIFCLRDPNQIKKLNHKVEKVRLNLIKNIQTRLGK